MSQDILPCLSYPTTVVFVDDDEKFLQQAGAIIRRELPYSLYKDPKEALKFLNETYKLEPFTKRCAVESLDASPDHRVIDFNIRLIREEVYNPNRSKENGVVILDFAMHDINGGELAKQLKGKPYKIILLTGEAGTQTAVKLFNEGVIQRYIRKDDAHFKEILFESIKNLQQQYFADISRVVLDSFTDRKWYKDPVFKKLIEEIFMANNLKESFLLDEYGSYKFLKADGKQSFLAVTNEDMMETYLDYAIDVSPPDIVEGLKSKSIMPFFLNEEDFDSSPRDWGPYMHPAKALRGLDTYYYSYIENPDPKIYKLENKIFSYDDFLKAQG